MKFNIAWSKIASENQTLKFIVLILGAFSILFSFMSLKLALREPLVIERGCFSKIATKRDAARTKEEIESFLKDALSQRFDSKAVPKDGFLSLEEIELKAKEQKELDSRKLTQRVLLNSIEVDAGKVAIDADRVISIGEIRSAFKFLLMATIESVRRTEGNPYGLILERIQIVQKSEK